MARLLALAALCLVLAACGSAPGPDVIERDRFGYRVGSGPDRETVLLRPVADSTQYLVFPAVVDGVTVRPAGRPAPGDAVAVEVLIEGALPDACAELSSVSQRRQLRFVEVDLMMRQPKAEVCAAVVRPFRFYVVLDGAYAAGSYILELNGSATPFQVLPAILDAEGGDG